MERSGLFHGPAALLSGHNLLTVYGHHEATMMNSTEADLKVRLYEWGCPEAWYRPSIEIVPRVEADLQVRPRESR
jgi:hypothetical protein